TIISDDSLLPSQSAYVPVGGAECGLRACGMGFWKGWGKVHVSKATQRKLIEKYDRTLHPR
ncbi:hypothetical protein Q5690_29905, partial [Microcoleus sp. F10-D1]